MELLLIRHAQPFRVERDDGQAANPALTPLGHQQAAAMAEWVAAERLDALYVSPLVRARETAAPLAARFGLEPVVVDLLAEYDRHDAVYIPIEEMKAKATDADRARWEELLAGNESPERLAWCKAVHGAIEELVEANRGRRIAAVCHGGVINAYMAAILGVERALFFEPYYCSVNRVIAASSGERSVLTLNEAPFLRGLPLPGAAG